MVQEMKELSQQPGIILRFHALKALNRLAARDGNTVVPWKLVIGHREKDASRMHQLLKQICNSGLTQLLLMRIRPATMKRSPLAVKTGQMMKQEA